MHKCKNILKSNYRTCVHIMLDRRSHHDNITLHYSVLSWLASMVVTDIMCLLCDIVEGHGNHGAAV